MSNKVYSDYYEEYFEDIEDYKEQCEAREIEMEDYVFATYENIVKIPPWISGGYLTELILEKIHENEEMPENYDEDYLREHMSGLKEFEDGIDKLINEFNEQQTLKFYDVDFSKKIKVEEQDNG